MGFLQTFTGGGSLTYKDAVRTASSANVPLTGSAPILIGGVSLNDKDRVLLKDQANATQNGIYVATISGGTYTLTRSPDCNTSKEMKPNMIVPVSEGTFADKYFQLTNNDPITLGTTLLAFDYASVVDHGLLVGLNDDDHTQYHNDTRANTWLSTKSTSDLAEGTNLYFTDQRAIDALENANSILYKDITYVNQGSNTIQSAINAHTGLRKEIHISPGVYSENLTFNSQDTLKVSAPAVVASVDFARLDVSNTVTISGTASRIHLLNFNAPGGLTINGTTGRHYFRDMTLGGLTLLGATTNFLVFENCTFSGPVTIPATFAGTIYFRECDFSNQTITNSATLAVQVLVVNCSNLASFTFGNRTLIGLNVLTSGASKVDSTDVTVDSLTANRALVSDGNKNLSSSTTTATELGYLSGVSSSVQTQLNNRELKGQITRTAVNANYLATTSDDYVGVDSNGGVVSVTLPLASTAANGKRIIIKDEGGAATTNNISIVGSGGDLIDGSASQSLVVNYESVTLICDGASEWFII